MSFSIWVCGTLFSRHVILMVQDVLVEMFWICGVQLRCSSIIRPQKLVCHSFNWLWIYCQLRGLKMMIMKKHDFCFLYIKGQLVYIKPFQNVVQLIVNILWYFLHFHGWTVWTSMSAVPKKAVKLNHSPTFSCFWHYIYYLLLYELLFFAISQICRIREVYMSFSIWVCGTLFSRHVILMVRDVLVELFWICGAQLVSIDCKAKEVTFCHSFNWLWIYCQLQGLNNLHCTDDNEKAWILFSYIKEHLVYIKPFRNAFNLIVNILWYFFHLHVFLRCRVAKQTQRTYQNLYHLHIM